MAFPQLTGSVMGNPEGPACKILVDVIIKWYEDNNPSHGVWGEIYNTGQIRVGGW